MPKMHLNTFGGRALPGPAEELKRSPGPLAAIKGVLLLRGGREKKGRVGRGGNGKGRGGEGKAGRDVDP